MAVQPTLKRQIFVSYAHADDLPFGNSSYGWVTSFVENLRKTLARCAGGSKVEIWIDHQLQPQRRVTPELRQKIKESAIFLAFMSPSYLESDWCPQEMTTFVQELGLGDTADRVFLVEILPTKREDWHEAARNISAIEFFRKVPTSPAPKILGWPLPDTLGDRAYWDEVSDLADAIAGQLAELSKSAGARSIPARLPPAEVVVAPPAISGPSTTSIPEAAHLSLVVHVADDEDQELVAAARHLLEELEVDAYMAPSKGSTQTPAQHRADVEGVLRDCHGVLVMYGLAPPSWVQSKHSEARKIFRGGKQGTWAGLVECPPEPKLAHGLPAHGLMVLDWRGGSRRDELKRFLDALRQGQGGSFIHV